MKRRSRPGIAAEPSAPYNAAWVVDASVAVKLHAPEEPYAGLAVALFERHGRRECSLHAPEFMLLEAASALRRRRRMPDDVIDAALARLAESGIEWHGVTPGRVRQACKLAGRHAVSVYDGLYAVLADELGGRVVTADLEFARRMASTGLVVALGGTGRG